MTKEKQSKRHQATEIIQLFREGRSDEALVLFEKYGFRKEFICFAVTRGIDFEDASDLVQKFIIDKLCMKSDSIEHIEYARTWMYMVFRNMINDQGIDQNVSISSLHKKIKKETNTCFYISWSL